MKVSCIIPAYNEETTIRDVIKKVKSIKNIDEIIVVDDGSKDQTFTIAKSENIKVISHKKNKGKGAAMKTGTKSATGQVIIFIDADLRNIGLKQRKNISKMVQIIKQKKADMVIGTYKVHCFQTFTELIYIPLMKLFFPEVSKIINQGQLSGQRAFRKKVLDKIPFEKGFGVEAGINIEFSMLKPTPKVKFVDLGEINLRPKGFQPSMCYIFDVIVRYAKKYNRFERLKNSSYKAVSKVLHEKLVSLE